MLLVDDTRPFHELVYVYFFVIIIVIIFSCRLLSRHADICAVVQTALIRLSARPRNAPTAENRSSLI